MPTADKVYEIPINNVRIERTPSDDEIAFPPEYIAAECAKIRAGWTDRDWRMKNCYKSGDVEIMNGRFGDTSE